MVKPGGNHMTPLTGDFSHALFLWLKSLFYHDLQIVRNIWDIISNQLNKIYNIVLVDFWIFYSKYPAYCIGYL